MTKPPKESQETRPAGRLRGKAGNRLVSMLFRHPLFGAAFIASLLAAFYWGIVASDRYVSEAHVIIQQTDIAGGQGTPSVGNLLGNLGAGAQTDQLLLRDHLLSVDMLKKLDGQLNLRAHYSDKRRDILSRMWFEDAELEWFHDHYLSRVLIEFDDYSGILSIKAEGYDPQTAYAIARTLVKEGELFMNRMAQTLAEDQVKFLEAQVVGMEQRVTDTRQTVLEFQNRKGLVSPEGTAQNFVAIVNRLEARITELQTRRATMLGYLMADSPNIIELDQQIAATEKQIQLEKAKLVSPKEKTLNRTVEEYQRLQLRAEFALEVYKTALAALEKGRIEATRNLKKVSVLQSPFEPQYPIEPRRIYNTVVFILVALLIAGIMHLIAAIIRDHKD